MGALELISRRSLARAAGHGVEGGPTDTLCYVKITRYENGHELRPGLRSIHHHNLTTPKFNIVSVLEEMDPDRWLAEVSLFDEVILEIPGTFSSSHEAGYAAEEALRKHLVLVFRALS